MKKALVLGSSGLVGMSVLSNLLQDSEYEEVITLVRKKQLIQHPKLKQIEVNFDRLEDDPDLFAVHDVFCCLGTTMKKAKSREAFRKVDYTYPLHAAQLSSRAGVEKFLLISALGSDDLSSIFYNRVKGELEREIKRVNVPTIFIFRPSLLLGERREFRLGEKFITWISVPLSFLFFGPIKKYKPIQSKAVADAMHQAARTDMKGIFTIESLQMQPDSEHIFTGIR
jgi:uncharacterized protein YbjT (DUF2867 family)